MSGFIRSLVVSLFNSSFGFMNDADQAAQNAEVRTMLDDPRIASLRCRRQADEFDHDDARDAYPLLLDLGRVAPPPALISAEA